MNEPPRYPQQPPPTALSDAQVDALIHRARHGDRDALGQLWRAYRRDLLSDLCRRAPEELAKEAVTDVFIDLMQKPITYARKDDASFPAWLRAVARNKLIDKLRSRRHILGNKFGAPIIADEDHYDDIDDVQADLHDPAADVYSQIEAQEERSIVQRCLQELSEDLRKTARLFYWQQKSYEEVAKLLNENLGTVKSRLHNARSKLMDCASRGAHGSHA